MYPHVVHPNLYTSILSRIHLIYNLYCIHNNIIIITINI